LFVFGQTSGVRYFEKISLEKSVWKNTV